MGHREVEPLAPSHSASGYEWQGQDWNPGDWTPEPGSEWFYCRNGDGKGGRGASDPSGSVWELQSIPRPHAHGTMPLAWYSVLSAQWNCFTRSVQRSLACSAHTLLAFYITTLGL